MNRKNRYFASLLALIYFLGIALVWSYPVYGQEKKRDDIIREYKWTYDHKKWTWSFGATEEQYSYFKNLKRLKTRDYSLYVSNPNDDEFIRSLVTSLKETKKEYGFSERQLIDFTVAFVQSLPYYSDIESTGFDEYPKYPLETLIENGGDCEDTSILMASLLKEMGYGVVLLRMPGHMAVGVKGGEDMPGTYYKYNGSKYYYLETTGENWTIGKVPKEHQKQKVTIYTLNPKPLVTHNWRTYTDGDSVIDVVINNNGTGTAENCQLYVAFDGGGNKVYNPKTSDYFSMEAGGGYTWKLSLKYPRKVKTRIIVKIISDGVVLSKSYGKWFTLN